MKNLILLTILSLAVFIFAGCQSSATTADGKTDTGESAGDIDTSKPIEVSEFHKAYFADEAKWKGKEVTLKGHLTKLGLPKDGDNRVLLTKYSPDPMKNPVTTIEVSCMASNFDHGKDLSKVDTMAMAKKGHQVKGTIKGTDKVSKYDVVVLEPCEYIY